MVLKPARRNAGILDQRMAEVICAYTAALMVLCTLDYLEIYSINSSLSIEVTLILVPVTSLISSFFL